MPLVLRNVMVPFSTVQAIRITRAFVAMRRALATLAPLLSRIETTELRQLKLEDAQARNEERFKLILDAMQDKKFPPQKVFYDGQIYDAFEQMKKFVRMAKKELIIIDPYFADSVLPLIAQGTAKHTWFVTIDDLIAGLRAVHSLENRSYNLAVFNCTDAALMVVNACGIGTNWSAMGLTYKSPLELYHAITAINGVVGGVE